MANLNRIYLIEAYMAGASICEIAKQCSSNYSMVRYHLIRAGVKLRTHRRALTPGHCLPATGTFQNMPGASLEKRSTSAVEKGLTCVEKG